MKYEIITPVVTAFDDNEKIDYESNKKIIDYLVEGGVDGILVLGSTGEFTGMSYEEKREFFKFYSEYVDGRLDLYAGTGSMNFKEVVKLTNEVTDMGYKGSFIIGEYYYGNDQEKLFLYYDRLAKEVKGDIYIYNFPARSGHSVDPITMRKLRSENKNIVGLKDSVTEPGHTNLCLIDTKDLGFDVYSGFDDQYLYNISAGGRGSIAALSNIVPEIWSSLTRASNEGNLEKTIKYQGLIQRLMPLYNMDCNFSYLFKLLMVERGLDINPTAVFPYNQLNAGILDESKKILEDVLEEFKTI